MSGEQELEQRLAAIEQVFDIQKIATQGQDSSDIEKYYRESSWAYHVFHSGLGAIHMALNADGVFDREGYYGQPNAVAEWLTSTTKKVLELASGNGFNACHLAKMFPDLKFTGIDLVRSEIDFAKKHIHGTDNLTFLQGDFHSLPFNDNTFDVAYVIESICHSTDMRKALSEAYRVLRTDGVLIVVDAWQTAACDQLSPLVQKAANLAQQSMAVGKPWKLNEWLQLAKRVGFIQEFDKDFTAAIMPNLFRFEHMATRYFAHPHLARIAARILPSRLLQNAIAGYLMPLTVDAGAHTYRMVVLRRPGIDRKAVDEKTNRTIAAAGGRIDGGRNHIRDSVLSP
jgi:ubiquinone/menaquinone biosynthesis C-methylase UbiE